MEGNDWILSVRDEEITRWGKNILQPLRFVRGDHLLSAIRKSKTESWGKLFTELDDDHAYRIISKRFGRRLLLFRRSQLKEVAFSHCNVIAAMCITKITLEEFLRA